MSCPGKRGQLLTTDFILSLAIFLAILLASMSLWANVDTQIRDAESRRDMQAITTYISDSLVRSPGYPKNWTNSTVMMIGLANDEHVVDMNKILLLKNMDYDRVRDILRFGEYNYYIWVTDGGGYDLTSGIVRSPVAVIAHKKSGMEYAKMLNNSVVTWDLYWDDNSGLLGPDDLNQPYINAFAPRTSYPSSRPDSSLIKFMGGQGSYRTLIVEDTGLLNDTVADISQLINFTKRGGIIIYADTDTLAVTRPLIAGWSGESFAAPTGNSVVNNSGSVLLNASPGNGISFTSHKRDVFRNQAQGDAGLNFIANSTATNCQICWWDYGFGRIYYIEDNQGTLTNATGSYPLTPLLNIVGENMTMGVKPSNRTDLVSIRRMAIVSGFEREVANVNIIVWR